MALCVGIAILTIIFSLPLYFGKIKRNYYYGLRTPKTLSSDAIWFLAQRNVGLYLILAGTVVLLTALGLFLLKSILTVPVMAGIMIFVAIFSLVGAIFKSFMALSRY